MDLRSGAKFNRNDGISQEFDLVRDNTWGAYAFTLHSTGEESVHARTPSVVISALQAAHEFFVRRLHREGKASGGMASARRSK